MVGVGIGLCAFLVALWALAAHGSAPLRVLGLLHALFGLVLGLPGLLGALMWAFTEHTVTYRNENLLLSNPLTFLLFPLGLGMLLNWQQRWTAQCSILMSCCN